MNLSKTAIDFLVREEGLKTSVYKDTEGEPTIGVGHQLTPTELGSGNVMVKGKVYSWKLGLPIEICLQLLEQDVNERYGKSVSKYVKVPLTQNQFDALVLLCYNIGEGHFKNSTLVKKLNAKLYNDIPNEFRKWRKDKGKVSKVLVARREKEIAIWEGNV